MIELINTRLHGTDLYKVLRRKIFLCNGNRITINVTLGPESPGIPDGPIGPIGPGAPFSPGEPTSPGIPCLPSCPGRPSDPGGPGGPGGPGSPGSPCYVPRACYVVTGFLLTRALDKSVSRCSSVLCHGRMGPEKEQRGVGVGERIEKERDREIDR